MNTIEVRNMTKLFNKEILLYSFFDIRFNRPVRATLVFYFALLLGIIGYPVIKFFGFNPYAVIIAVGVPGFLANIISKPIFNGRSFFAWLLVLIKYKINPKIYYDGKAYGSLKNYDIDEYYLVSREKDYNTLFMLELSEKGGIFKRKKRRTI